MRVLRPVRLGRGLSILSVVVVWCAGAHAGVIVRVELDPGAFACVKGARTAGLECRPPTGGAAQAFFAKYLAQPDEWQRYKSLTSAVAIPFEQLNGATQRRVLLAVFPQDVVTDKGWWHAVQFAGASGLETLWTLCEWLTGKGTNYKAVEANPRNAELGDPLALGQRVFVPAELLRPALRAPTPERFNLLESVTGKTTARPAGKASATDKPAGKASTATARLVEPEVNLDAASRDLFFGNDPEGPYAMYRLKQGEALYTAVVVRFTGYAENEDILNACKAIQKRSHIADVHQMKPGQQVLIPVDMLSDRYHPQGSAPRQQYEEALREASRIKKEQVVAKGLAGVVVVLDPGHGGRDHGAPRETLGLYEDELNYDIVCRIKRIIETRTQAKVYVTVLDPSQKYEPTAAEKFRHDTDEVLLTTPHYENTDATTSANLRWYLANSIYRKELKNGADARKIVFTSVHADALFKESLRGAMVYIPGAAYRRTSECPSGSCYNAFKEAQEQRKVTTTESERKRDEALSRNFAVDVLQALAEHDPPIMCHNASDPIRNQIRQTGRKPYVVAVLRNTQIPTKILIETANMINATDCNRLADPKWREWFAEAYVDALRAHFGEK